MLLEITTNFDSSRTRERPDGSMWCLVHLERASPNALATALKEQAFDVHIAPDIDDLLDALWYHGSTVGRIVLEISAGEGLDDTLRALKEWPDLEVLIFTPEDPSMGKATRRHRFEQCYSLDSVLRWLGGAHSRSLDGDGAS